MLAAIGEVAAESAIVEEGLRELFTYLIDSPYGAVITSGEDISRVAQMCLRVAQYNHRLSEEQLDELVRLLKAVEVGRPLRNFVVHARWDKLTAPGEHAGVRSSRASTRPSASSLDEFNIWHVEDVLKLAENFRELGNRIDDFIERSFDSRSYPRLMSRASQAQMDAFFARIGWPRAADESTHEGESVPDPRT